MYSINIIYVNHVFKYIFCISFKYVLFAAREKFLILKNGSDYQGAWPSLLYEQVTALFTGNSWLQITY